METTEGYVAIDRRHALARGEDLPDRVQGAALFADVSGFTPLTEALANELGLHRGAEELAGHLNGVYEAIVSELERYGGAVLGFAGDAITCWFDADDGLRATASALAMQAEMRRIAPPIVGEASFPLSLKVAVACGPARRFAVGDPDVLIVDVLCGALLDTLAAAESCARAGEIVLDPCALAAVGDAVRVREHRTDPEGSREFGVVDRLESVVEPAPWPAVPTGTLDAGRLRPWLLPAVWERLAGGRGEFLTELRPVVTLFLAFAGIDYDGPGAREQLDRFVRRVEDVLGRYDASLLQVVMGDKGGYLYAAFGAPIAHEDDAARAAAAALDLCSLSAEGVAGGLRVGIARGRMIAGAYGSTSRRTYGVLGDTVNLSARLMQAAGPGEIIGTAEIARATRDSFEWHALPDLEVKGKSRPVAVFTLTGGRAVRAHRAVTARRLVGRAVELASLEEALTRASEGGGQVVGVSGEAGVGKSRLVEEGVARARALGFDVHTGQCQSYGASSSYLPWVEIWRGLLGLAPGADPDPDGEAVAAALGRIDERLVPRAPLLGAVLGIPIAENDLTRAFDPKLRKTSLEALLVDCLRAIASERPLLLVLEDCHWLDELSQDLVAQLARAASGVRAAFFLSYRPPDADPRARPLAVGQLAHFREVALAELGLDDAQALIRARLAEASGDDADVALPLVEALFWRSEGNPFYLEELLAYLAERGIEPSQPRGLDGLDLPNSLHSLVLSRIDRLAEHPRTTLKVASVLGRTFDTTALRGFYPELGPAEQVDRDLATLGQATLVVPEGGDAYLFRHAVTREVAYESLPFTRRAVLHSRVGRYLERAYTGEAGLYLGLLAHHFGLGDDEPRKRRYLLEAARAAQAEYANAAAIDLFRRALPLLEESDRSQVRVELGRVLERLGAWDEADASYAEAHAIAEESGDRGAAARAETASGDLLRKRGRYDEAAEFFDRARETFLELGDREGVGRVLHVSGTLAAQRGDYALARERYDASAEIRRSLGDRTGTAAVLSNLGVVAEYEREYDSALALHADALALHTELGDRWGVAVSRNNMGNIALLQGRIAEARGWLEEALAIQREIGDPWMIANVLNNLGNVVREIGDLGAAEALYAESLAIYRALGDMWALAYLLEDVGALAALQDEPERALRICGAAAALRERIGAPRPAADQATLEERLRPAEQALGDEARDEAWAAGRGLAVEQAIVEARRES